MPFLAASGIALAASVAGNNAQTADSPAAAAAAALPSGTSDEFREQMVNWRAVPQPRLMRARNGQSGASSARLDRLAISSRFGWRSDPITGSGRRHEGIDLPSRYGSAVMATAAGVVRFAGWAGGYGKMVEIEHIGGVSTRYGHLSEVDVAPFDHVKQGQVIGEVGSTGHSTGPHLHFEVRVAGTAVDPLTFVGQRAAAVDTIWGANLHAASKWSWWSEASGKTLPEASLR